MSKRSHRQHRRGATAVEVAIVLPMFLFFVLGTCEFGRVVWINNLLHNACRTAARYGAIEGRTSTQVANKVRAGLMSSIDTSNVVVAVKDASVFETSNDPPDTAEEYDALSDIELASAESRQLFLVRATINYNQISFFNYSFTNGLTLGSQALQRHE